MADLVINILFTQGEANCHEKTLPFRSKMIQGTGGETPHYVAGLTIAMTAEAGFKYFIAAAFT